MAKQTIRVIIDARVGAGEISGSAHRELDEPMPFTGWLELLAALDVLLDGTFTRVEPDGDRGDGHG